VDLFPELSTLSDSELDGMLNALEGDEDAISRRRRVLHGRIDILRSERVVRLKNRIADGDLPVPDIDWSPDALERPLFEGTGETPEPEAEIEPMPDLRVMSDDELRLLIAQLEHDEDDISLQRRVLHGRIDILRSERTRRRHGGGWDPDSLAETLARGSEPPASG
jgi:hypothetical protein